MAITWQLPNTCTIQILREPMNCVPALDQAGHQKTNERYLMMGHGDTEGGREGGRGR